MQVGGGCDPYYIIHHLPSEITSGSGSGSGSGVRSGTGPGPGPGVPVIAQGDPSLYSVPSLIERETVKFDTRLFDVIRLVR